MPTRTERDAELRSKAAAGGFQLAQVVGLFLDARDATGQRDSLDTEQMIQVILNYEVSTQVLQPDPQPDAATLAAIRAASTGT